MPATKVGDRHHLRLAALVLFGLTTIGCSSEPVSTAPDLTAVFAKPAAQTAVAAIFTMPASGFGLTSDGTSQYSEGVCGVVARVFYQAPNYLDGNLQLNNPRAKDRDCTVRKLTITYPDNGLVQSHAGGMNINDMGTVTSASGPGLRSMNIAIASTTSRCKRLGFGNAIGGSQVLVTRVNATTWNVASQAGGSAACEQQNGVVVPIADFSVNFAVALR